MPAAVFDDPCLLFALPREARPFWRSFRERYQLAKSPLRLRCRRGPGESVLVVVTGMGAARMQSAVDWALSEPLLADAVYRPRAVICAGFAGGLQQGARVGDLILAAEVIDSGGQHWRTTWPREPADVSELSIARGAVLTAPAIVGETAQKIALGRLRGGLCVDLESAVVAATCSRHGVPFGCLRAISDPVETSLSPRLLSILADDRLSLPRLLAGLVRSPRLAGELWRLARDTRHASRRLAAGLTQLLALESRAAAAQRA